MTHTLMVQHKYGTRTVQYEDAEMEELFSKEERATLSRGGVVTQTDKHDTLRWVDVEHLGRKALGA